MSKQKKKGSGLSERVVFEVTSVHGTDQVEGATVAELREKLEKLLRDEEPYCVQAMALLAFQKRAEIRTPQWSIRRLGVMRFEPETRAEEPVRKASKPAAPLPPMAPSQEPARVVPPAPVASIQPALLMQGNVSHGA